MPRVLECLSRDLSHVKGIRVETRKPVFVSKQFLVYLSERLCHAMNTGLNPET